ncbi:MAG: hypothetical protein HYU53_15140 [Acidobacteria bacterium]|nr:hypothetical protein [Acidobacteriota bacterium]
MRRATCGVRRATCGGAGASDGEGGSNHLGVAAGNRYGALHLMGICHVPAQAARLEAAFAARRPAPE